MKIEHKTKPKKKKTQNKTERYKKIVTRRLWEGRGRELIVGKIKENPNRRSVAFSNRCVAATKKEDEHRKSWGR